MPHRAHSSYHSHGEHPYNASFSNSSLNASLVPPSLSTSIAHGLTFLWNITFRSSPSRGISCSGYVHPSGDGTRVMGSIQRMTRMTTTRFPSCSGSLDRSKQQIKVPDKNDDDISMCKYRGRTNATGTFERAIVDVHPIHPHAKLCRTRNGPPDDRLRADEEVVEGRVYPHTIREFLPERAQRRHCRDHARPPPDAGNALFRAQR